MNTLRIVVVCVLAAAPVAGSRAPAAPTAVMTCSGGFFALSVADMKASAAWYVEKLGLTVVMEEPAAGHPGVTVLEGGGLIVELVQDPEAMPLAKVAPGLRDRMLVHGLVKAGVIVNNFPETLTAFRERHVDIAFGPFPARSNQRANVIVLDNAGNLIQVFGATSN